MYYVGIPLAIVIVVQVFRVASLEKFKLFHYCPEQLLLSTHNYPLIGFNNSKMFVIDLDFSNKACHGSLIIFQRKESCVSRLACVHSNHELHTPAKPPSIRRKISGQFQLQKVLMSRSFSRHVICTIARRMP